MTEAILTKLSPHFSVAEMTATSVDTDNTPDEQQLRSPVVLCTQVLEPWRARVGSLRVTSGFRSQTVNDELRRRGYSASRTSQHLRGEAADLAPLTFTIEAAWHELARQVALGLPVDQAIVYQRPKGLGWVHVSCVAPGQGRADLRVQPSGQPGVYASWADWRGPLVL